MPDTPPLVGLARVGAPVASTNYWATLLSVGRAIESTSTVSLDRTQSWDLIHAISSVQAFLVEGPSTALIST